VNQEKITHRKIFQDDYGPALNWYRAAIQNVNAVDEEDGRLDPQLTVPVLMITASNDPTGGPKFAEHVKNFAADLTEQQINAGHWVQLEKKAETNKAIAKFLNCGG
jgi:soluble epoxide hydrolase/lipid-phosphate phosphatase